VLYGMLRMIWMRARFAALSMEPKDTRSDCTGEHSRRGTTKRMRWFTTTNITYYIGCRKTYHSSQKSSPTECCLWKCSKQNMDGKEGAACQRHWGIGNAPRQGTERSTALPAAWICNNQDMDANTDGLRRTQGILVFLSDRTRF